MTEKMIADTLALAKIAAKAESEYETTPGSTAEVWAKFLTFARADMEAEGLADDAEDANRWAKESVETRAKAFTAVTLALANTSI